MSLQTLLQPYQLNDFVQLKNRLVMAPMTRNMANDDLSPTPAMADYYARRADAGLIITEGTIIRPDGRGYSHVPGIYTAAQIKGWQAVTKAVHARQGKIFLQIWHVGRVSHPFFLNGQLPLSPSATTMKGKVARMKDLHYGTSREASLAEIHSLIASYATAARNAMEAGFDGIELHGANGYLIDQFLHYHTNLRGDDYGRTFRDKARFALEVVSACVAAIGAERVGLRLSPGAYLNEIAGDSRDAEVFQYLLQQLNEIQPAYVHTGNFDDSVQFSELGNKTMTEFIRHVYDGTVIASGGYTLERAAQGIDKGDFDLIAIGRPFIANPDLVERFKTQRPLLAYDASLLSTLW
ncbi:NADH-dependent flavin oxidoreductase, Oye family [Legionella rubrilucens]|uniref:NADH-dependent flavin oxidoreductase, Oye family n=1 Tax=Legionella rubrilucens TaxID=458 RepID=A0A0W0XMR6_9GAMM|nr:alkene reductase [Legionella rubrilucens]KTD45867.1 NADH-dependent flavin oxidoreductase, Oye family [Legionella rubrilucens]